LDYNAAPVCIELQGVRRENHKLFRMLDAIEEAAERGRVFNDFMSVKFHLHEWERYQSSARLSLRNNYLKFIRNWGIDSNSASGAVLKSWVESRIGLRPSFHRTRLAAKDVGAWYQYRQDVTTGSMQSSAILSQFDLLYEFCQYEWTRRQPQMRWLPLYRGTHDPDEYVMLQPGGNRRTTVRLNNLSSFTSDRERAWEFGSTVWKVHVPVYKVFFFSGLLPDNLLRGEEEYLVIGGDFEVEHLLY
jgi:NAD+---dinitrogen-reductase ADP-D-ribosyltransferase